ncbi:MAG: hypothetical protein JKY56_25655 [Kofleriaceae bacterium]|nr:hypothetical protein [Kofleriaceae bacterium]
MTTTKFALVLALTLLGGACAEPDANDNLGDDDKGDHAIKARKVLIMPINNQPSNSPSDFGSDDNCFYDNALILRDWYRDEKDAEVTFLSVNTPDFALAKMKELEAADALFDRIIILGHGSGNGPGFCCDYLPQPGNDFPSQDDRYGQENIDYMQDFYGTMGQITDPAGWIYVGACNPGIETTFEGFDNFLQAMSCISGRTTLGTATKTACWDVTDRLKRLDGGDHVGVGDFSRALVEVNACDVVNNGNQLTCAALEEGVDCSTPSIDNSWGTCDGVDGVNGQCQDTDVETCGVPTLTGHCPGPAPIQCCPS